jgi:hypothetical protein
MARASHFFLVPFDTSEGRFRSRNCGTAKKFGGCRIQLFAVIVVIDAILAIAMTAENAEKFAVSENL